MPELSLGKWTDGVASRHWVMSACHPLPPRWCLSSTLHSAWAKQVLTQMCRRNESLCFNPTPSAGASFSDASTIPLASHLL